MIDARFVFAPCTHDVPQIRVGNIFLAPCHISSAASHSSTNFLAASFPVVTAGEPERRPLMHPPGRQRALLAILPVMTEGRL